MWTQATRVSLDIILHWWLNYRNSLAWLISRRVKTHFIAALRFLLAKEKKTFFKNIYWACFKCQPAQILALQWRKRSSTEKNHYPYSKRKKMCSIMIMLIKQCHYKLMHAWPISKHCLMITSQVKHNLSQNVQCTMTVT